MNPSGIAQIQARIATIQSRFQPPAARAGAATDDTSFAGALAGAELAGLAGAGGSGSGAIEALTAKLRATAGGAGPPDVDTLLGGSGGMTLDALLATTSGAAGGVGARTAAFLAAALEQAGDPYVWGASADPGDADPDAFDCSELVRWAAGRVGVDLPDGSWLQYLHLKQQGATISVEEALRTPGALLFAFDEEPRPGGGRPPGAHVAISLGDGRTIEARGRSYGVGTWEADGRFGYAALVPELTGSPSTATTLGRPLGLSAGA